jgi:hypothetical protein
MSSSLSASAAVIRLSGLKPMLKLAVFSAAFTAERPWDTNPDRCSGTEAGWPRIRQQMAFHALVQVSKHFQQSFLGRTLYPFFDLCRKSFLSRIFQR